MGSMKNFSKQFSALTGFEPMPWQEALYARFIVDSDGNIPPCCDIPTGLGKTSVIAIWLIVNSRFSNEMQQARSPSFPQPFACGQHDKL